MSIHALLAAQRCLAWAPDDVPVVLAGDWNITPETGAYEVLTKGSFGKDTDAKEIPTKCYENDSFELSLRRPFSSAYAVVDGEEPEFTNYAKCGTATETFCEPIDYIFVAKSIGKAHFDLRFERVDDLTEIISETKKLDSLPSATQGSDHIPLGCEMSWNK